jgi:hypothetical protein
MKSVVIYASALEGLVESKRKKKKRKSLVSLTTLCFNVAEFYLCSLSHPRRKLFEKTLGAWLK